MLHWLIQPDRQKHSSAAPREIELKLEIEPADVPRLLELPCFRVRASHERLISAYFDTPKLKLRRNGWVLRVRQSDGRFVQTVKHSGESAGLFDRGEWEDDVEALQPERRAIERTPLTDVIKPRHAGRLKAICRSDVDRSTFLVEADDARIELTYDDGLVEACDASEPIHEVELELKEGDLKALLSVARNLVAEAPLKIGIQSKSERGFALADGKTDIAVKAASVKVSDEMSLAEGFAAIVTGCLKHMRMNEPLLAAERDPEALHQLRVAVRRLRSALWLFRPAVRDGEFAGFNSHLRRFTRELGAARNIDVILSSMALNDPARGQLEEDRGNLYAKILRKLDSRSFRLFLFDLLAWVHVGEWRNGKKADRALVRFAVKRLDRLWERIENRAGDLPERSDEERHKLRIDTKKMRYAVEFLADPLRRFEDDRASFAKAAEAVQDRLGRINDMATRSELLAESDPSADKAKMRHLRAAKRHLCKLEEIGPFWREVGA